MHPNQLPAHPRSASVFVFARGHVSQYANLEPEINSDNIHRGAGCQSLTDAAGSWAHSAVQIHHTATAFKQVLTELLEQWSGPAATRLNQAAAPFHRWLSDLTLQLNQTATQINEVERAFHVASQETVRPEQIDANRDERAEVVASNPVGHDIDKIVQLDAEYDNFWTGDVDAMRKYEEQVRAVLAGLPSLQEPPPARMLS